MNNLCNIVDGVEVCMICAVQFVYVEAIPAATEHYYLFRTNANLTAKQLTEKSWEPQMAGCFATRFDEFQHLLIKRGFTCELLHILSQHQFVARGFSADNIVVGATGKY